MKFTPLRILAIAGCLSLLSPDARAQHVGDLAEDVRVTLGAPSIVRQAGDQQVWVYDSGSKVTIENGRVIEVRGRAVAIPSRNAPPPQVEPVAATAAPATAPVVERPKAKAPAKPGKRAGAPAKPSPPPVLVEEKSSVVKWIGISIMVVLALWVRSGNKRAPSSPVDASRPKALQFRLPPGGWIALGVYGIFFVVLPAFASGKAASAYGVGFIFGTLGAALTFPTIIAALTWRMCGRSTRASATAFYVVLGLITLGGFVQNLNRAKTAAALEGIAQENRRLEGEQLAAMEKGETVDLSANSEKMAGQLDAVVQTAHGEERDALEAVQALLKHLMEAGSRYQTMVADLSVETFFDLEPLATRDAIAARREKVAAFQAENVSLRAEVVDAENRLRREMQQRGVSESTIKDAITGFRNGAAVRLELTLKIRDCDATLAVDLLQFLDLVETNVGRWHHDKAAGRTVFDDPAAVAKFRQILGHVSAVGLEQEGYQKDLLRQSQEKSGP